MASILQPRNHSTAVLQVVGIYCNCLAWKTPQLRSSILSITAFPSIINIFHNSRNSHLKTPTSKHSIVSFCSMWWFFPCYSYTSSTSVLLFFYCGSTTKDALCPWQQVERGGNTHLFKAKMCCPFFFSDYFLLSWSFWLFCLIIPIPPLRSLPTLLFICPLASLQKNRAIKLLFFPLYFTSLYTHLFHLLLLFSSLSFHYSLTVSSPQDQSDRTVISHQPRRRLTTESWARVSPFLFSLSPLYHHIPSLPLLLSSSLLPPSHFLLPLAFV